MLWFDTPVTAKSRALALGFENEDAPTDYGLYDAPYVDLVGATKLFYIVEFAG